MAAIPETLLHYRILQPLGSGGMGEVYLAEDTKLGRRVALKVLPIPEAAEGHERRQRLEREARIVAALNHPNIVTIYAVEATGDLTFLAMELIEGRTLSDLLPEHGLPLRDILKLAIPVAEAMAAAHDRGITHRDLKPANIMVTTDGRVKVLDFGLAKLTVASAFDEVTKTRVQADSLTGEGRLVGTVSYMSPEQVEGKTVDRRSDIFALGIVLYEMATGVRPFTGESTVAVLSAILRDAPKSISEINLSLPRDLARIVKRALAKDPDHRYQTARDLRNDLEALREDLDSGAIAIGSPVIPAAVEPVRRHRWWPVLAAAGVVAGLAGYGGWYYATHGPWWSSDASNALAFDRIKLSRLTSTGTVRRSAISGDGRYVVYVVADAGKQSLWLRQVATTSNVQIVEPGDPIAFVGFSPDANFVHYVVYPQSQSFSTVFQIPTLGGQPRRIMHDVDSPLAFSPDGRQVAFVRGSNVTGEDAIVVANIDGSGERPLAARKRPLNYRQGVLAWSPDGSVIIAIRRVEGRLRWGAAAVDLKTGKETDIGGGWGDISSVAWTPNGRGLVMTAREDVAAGSQIWHLAYPDGGARRITRDLNEYSEISLSADGRSLVATQGENLAHLWVWPLDDLSNPKQITTGPNRSDGSRGVAWTTDQRIVYTSNAGISRDIWIVDAAGRNARQLTVDPADDIGPSVTPDGRSILFISGREGGSIWRMDLDGGNQRPLVTAARADWPLVSRDGWLYYTSSAEARRSVWRMPVQGGPAERLTARWEALGVTDEGLFFHPSIALFELTADGTRGLGLYSDPERRGFRVGLFPLTGGSPVRFDIASSQTVITPDGRHLIYMEIRDGTPRLSRQPIAGGSPEVLATLPAGTRPSVATQAGRQIALSPDGKFLAMSLGAVTSDIVLITQER